MIDSNLASRVGEAILTLVIGGIPITIVAYLLGVRQANINWKRELAQREKERAEEMRLLREQLEEQKRQSRLAEEIHREEKAPKQKLVNWKIK